MKNIKILEVILNDLFSGSSVFLMLLLSLLISLSFVAKILKVARTAQHDNASNLGKHAVLVVTAIALCNVACLTFLIFLSKL
ncbi:MAG: hypothetical protein HUU50_00680 [Candidatus Brocadiae bacterium]|nr:hypothetical protein [Candidatus Brocadiia bacterium]